MSSEILVSVIIPVFNAEKYIGMCLQSIQVQTYNHLEIIVVDDGSNDSSHDICLSAAIEDPRIHVFKKENGGVSSARNLGVSLARGDFISFVDSDDTIHEEMIAVMLDQITKDESDLCVLYQYRINLRRPKINARIIPSTVALENLLLLSFPTSLWAVLYRKESIRGIWLSEDIHFFEDFLFNYSVLKQTNRVSICNLMLYNYRITESSVNAQTINERKMSCLLIYDRLVKDHYTETSIDNRLQYFRMHCLLTCLLAASKSPFEVSYIHIPQIQEYARHILRDVILSSHIGINRKVICLCAAIDTHSTCSMMSNLSRMFRKNTIRMQSKV